MADSPPEFFGRLNLTNPRQKSFQLFLEFAKIAGFAAKFLMDGLIFSSSGTFLLFRSLGILAAVLF